MARDTAKQPIDQAGKEDALPTTQTGAGMPQPARDELPMAEAEPNLPAPELPPIPAEPQPSVSAADLAQPGGPLPAIWQRRAIWLGPVALVLASVGEYLLFSEASRGAGVLLLVLAALAGIMAWNGARSTPWPAAVASTEAGWRHIAWRRELVVRLALILLAAWLSIASIAVYLRDPSAIFGWQGVLWLAGMAMLLFSCAGWYPDSDAAPADESSETPEATRRTIFSGAIPAWPRWEVLLFAALIALSLITHLAYLDQIPWRLHFDEGFAYTEVMRFYRGPAIPLFGTTWVGTGLPTMWFGIAGLLMHITGPNLAGVRLAVALAGALTVIPVYGLGKLLAGTRGAVLAAFAVAVSAVYIHYSRISIINVTTPLAWAVCFYFLLRGLRSRRPGDFVWAGLAAGLSMYTYYGTRLLPYLLALFLVYLLVFHFRAARERIGHFALLAVGFLAGFGPLIGYFVLNPQMWSARGLVMLDVPPVIPTSWDAIVADWSILAPLLWQNFLALSVVPSRDTVYWAPFLFPLEAALLVVGIGILLWRWRQPAAFLVLLWVAGVLFVGGTLVGSHDLPDFAHWTPAFPAFYLALALPIALWWNSLLKLPVRWLGIAGSLVIAALMMLDLGANAYFYLVQYPPLVLPDHSLEAAQGRYLESVEPNTHVRSVGNTWVWSQLFVPIDEMMQSPGTHLTRFVNPSRELPPVGEPGQNISFLFYNDVWDYVPVLQGYFPGGRLGEVRSPDGTRIAQSYFVPASVAASRYGVLSTFTPKAGGQPQWSGQVNNVGALPTGVQLTYPFTATWSGSFYVSQPGPTEVLTGPIMLNVQGVDKASLWVQGQAARADRPLDVEPGWVRFSLTTQLDGPRPVKLLLQQGDSPAAEIDRAHLWPTPLNQGLAVTANGSPSAHRIDPFVGAGVSQPQRGTDPGLDPEGLPIVSARPGSTQVRWEGELNTVDGLYKMEIRSDAASKLTIDGTPIIQMCEAPQGYQVGDGLVRLEAGWHHVQIDYRLGGKAKNIEWFWVRPDGVREVVPPSALRIAPDVSPGKIITWPVLPTPGPCQ